MLARREFCENYYLPGCRRWAGPVVRPLRWDFFYDRPGQEVLKLVRRLLAPLRRRQIRRGPHFSSTVGRYLRVGVLMFARYRDPSTRSLP
jgi:hypothetical protein